MTREKIETLLADCEKLVPFSEEAEKTLGEETVFSYDIRAIIAKHMEGVRE